MLCFYSDYKITYFFYLRQFFTLYFLFFERHENGRTSFLKDMRTEEQVFLKDMRTEEHVFFERHENRRTCFLKDIRTEEHVLSLNQRTCSSVLLSYPSQTIPMFFCSSVLPLANNPHVLMFSCLIPRKQSPCSSVLLSYPSQAIPMFSCLITMHIFLIPIKILNCFSLPYQISFILLYINILSLRKIENSIYTFYRNGTSTL